MAMFPCGNPNCTRKVLPNEYNTCYAHTEEGKIPEGSYCADCFPEAQQAVEKWNIEYAKLFEAELKGNTLVYHPVVTTVMWL